jgi:hypothetical protein
MCGSPVREPSILHVVCPVKGMFARRMGFAITPPKTSHIEVPVQIVLGMTHHVMRTFA